MMRTVLICLQMRFVFAFNKLLHYCTCRLLMEPAECSPLSAANAVDVVSPVPPSTDVVVIECRKYLPPKMGCRYRASMRDQRLYSECAMVFGAKYPCASTS